MINLANAIALQALYQVWLMENLNWPNSKMAKCVFYNEVVEELLHD